VARGGEGPYLVRQGADPFVSRRYLGCHDTKEVCRTLLGEGMGLLAISYGTFGHPLCPERSQRGRFLCGLAAIPNLFVTKQTQFDGFDGRLGAIRDLKL
jgi:hypothetical protein